MNQINFRIAAGFALCCAAGAQSGCSSSDQNSDSSGGVSSSAGSGGSKQATTAGAGTTAGGAPTGGASGAAAGNGAAGGVATSGGAAEVGNAAGGGLGGSLGSGGAAGSGGAPTSTGLSFVSSRVVVTGVRGTTSPAAASTIALHNGAEVTATITSLALSGPNQALFRITSPAAFPVTLAAGADVPVTVELTTTGPAVPAAPANKDSGSVLLSGTLTATSSVGSPAASVYGLVLTLVNYEPTLGQILTTLGYPLNVGKAQNNWNPNTSMDATMLPGVEPGTDEVAASRFVKAGSGNVGLTLVARFSPVGALPYGWYSATTGCPAGCTTVGTMAQITDPQTSDKARMVYPPNVAGTLTEFDPGSAPFGLWVNSDQKTQKFKEGGNMVNGDWDYSQEALNSPANVHRFKTYPLKDATGVAVPKTYLVAVEEAGNGDYQDYVFVLSNVTAMP